MRSLLTSACLFGCLLAPTAQAAEISSITLKYVKADLASEAGAAALYDRLAEAAKTVCKADDILPRSDALASERQCEREAMAKAVAKVDAPVLRAYYEAALHAPRNAATKSETLASR